MTTNTILELRASKVSISSTFSFAFHSILFKMITHPNKSSFIVRRKIRYFFSNGEEKKSSTK